MSFDSKYIGFVEKYLGRPVAPADGVAASRLVAAETRLGVPLPDAMRTYYSILGNCAELNSPHNRLFSPEVLSLDGGFLVFMDENQNVVSWGIRVEGLDSPEPVVWQRNNTPPTEWYSEEQSFPLFFESMFDWYVESGVWG